MFLFNRLGKDELRKRLAEENYERKTVSFYKYCHIPSPLDIRNELYEGFDRLSCLGRVYVATEGINAQMSVPEPKYDDFLEWMRKNKYLYDAPIKTAIEDNNGSFIKLKVKVKEKIVADGLDDKAFDVTNKGIHLSPIDFHEKMVSPNAIVVDVRNHYESEVGKFDNAFCPDADTFKDAIKIIEKELRGTKDKELLLYCTGGIRCEKASAYFKHKGYKKVYQLEGGIIEYANQMRDKKIKPRFIGKNFVFDERLGERIDDSIIAKCHQCGNACDTHINCNNDACHLLFIQCQECAKKYNNCCSAECKEIIELLEDEQELAKIKFHEKYANSKIFRSRYRKTNKIVKANR